MPIKKEKLLSPGFIFIAYIAAASIIILIFRMIYPGENEPLPIFYMDWRWTRGFLDIITFYPALVFSALVIPFGFFQRDGETYSKFSARLFVKMTPAVITAIFAALIYAVLFFLAYPMTRNTENTMRYHGEVYAMAKQEAFNSASEENWLEASQFIGICDSIWENSPEIIDLRAEVESNLREIRPSEREAAPPGVSISALPGQREPFNAADAISMGEAALREGRLLDAHWLATLGGRLARTGSIEAANASRLAAQAWNRLEEQQPTAREIRAFSLYQQKMSGYHAFQSGDYIRAFYIFKDLSENAPHDPDVENFLAASERGTREIAFFINDMEVSPGERLTGMVLSLPWQPDGHNGSDMQGRSVMRISSLSSSPDFAYGIGIEYMVFDSGSGGRNSTRPLFSMESQYAKFLPITIDNQHKVLVMMRTLDLYDSTVLLEPEWTDQEGRAPGTAQITLDLSYETFLKLSNMWQGLPGLQINQLFNARNIALENGYIPEVIETEILNRLGSCLFFLPMTIIVIVLGWRFRARKPSRYFFALSLPILPLVFTGFVYLYRIGLSVIGTSLILAVGFSTALTLFIVFLSLSFILSLILLAAQHSE
ncbi:MAG: serpentine receptor Srsx [Treponema sp.]|nr:serpentine receptor Srsx [Treponema sp.]